MVDITIAESLIKGPYLVCFRVKMPISGGQTSQGVLCTSPIFFNLLEEDEFRFRHRVVVLGDQLS